MNGLPTAKGYQEALGVLKLAVQVSLYNAYIIMVYILDVTSIHVHLIYRGRKIIVWPFFHRQPKRGQQQLFQ